jgi:nitrate/nitrite-specific signal transduction histidine kinase
VRPVHALTAATEKITGGDFTARAEILSHDELGHLAVEFNRMAEYIRQLRHSDCSHRPVHHSEIETHKQHKG